ncbi:ribonuclease III [Candidatus Thiosymbion oneisti]|uniref:ribonuclease III n=1 Tax=Candidatus Thiosymbion oneisti TaxID=589554 RepID=UPI000AA34289|nr:ribonuclease III [Candidatus Thiosymbion oneisti]
MREDPEQLAPGLGYEFREHGLLMRALTHRSASGENNERLEFLGDALLGFVIAEALWERFPDADEGRLSRLRASLVKRESLAALARGLDLGAYLRLGAGELRSGGHARESILADTLEAIFAAVYLDAGFATAREVILSVFATPLARVQVAGTSKDPKSRLQELLQALKRPLPEYQVLQITGSDHIQCFKVRCTLADGAEKTQGEGTSRRRAEQQAAERMLDLFATGADG